MRRIALAVLILMPWMGTAYSTPTVSTAPADPDVTVCVMAAAATDHVAFKDVDEDDCKCATRQLRVSLKPGDYALHEQMLEIIASGADKTAFDKKMSDIMLKRGMTQDDVDSFLARSKTAEGKAQATCNSSPLLGPDPAKPDH